MAGLNFGLFGDERKTQTADYRTAGSHQAENLNYLLLGSKNVWVEIHTVTTGKTYYISGIIISPVVTARALIGIGASGSETTIVGMELDLDTVFSLAMPTPIKLSSGTRISVRADEIPTHFTLIGW